MTKGNWSPDIVIQTIRDRAKDKKGLISTVVNQDNWRLLSAGKDLFGSWGAAVIAAGFDYDLVRQTESKAHHYKRIRTKPPTLTREAILTVIQRMVALDELPNRLQRQDIAIHTRACEEFGSWEKAIVAAGYDKSLAQHPTQSGIPGVFISLVPLDRVIHPNSDKTLLDYLGQDDPGFAIFESRNIFESLLKSGKLRSEMNALLRRVLDGDDLSESEYSDLASSVQEHPELLNLLNET